MTATLNGIQASTADLHVIAAPDGGTSGDAGSPTTSVVIAPTNPRILVGCPQPLTAVASHADGSTTDVTTSANWSSAPTFIASVGPGGVVTCIAPGTTTVTAASGGITGQTSATSVEPSVVSVKVTPSTSTVDAGDTVQYAASALYSTTQQCDVTEAAS